MPTATMMRNAQNSGATLGTVSTAAFLMSASVTLLMSSW